MRVRAITELAFATTLLVQSEVDCGSTIRGFNSRRSPWFQRLTQLADLDLI
ncbi:hypothetical protein H6F90_13525 [Trichocoleus sp. FACHB-591]|uniref:hypothetical protein n=1 Tax=Trichocoleus sp. FACHB-591 TaxID=2692872 RepID=UPI00198825EF|nr:hypothetical protein [Trichocoleus sp. FACHB-591]MBD2096158.1 hypothetical protein [Trichocoleus sp. FACHB-591]